MAFVLVLRSDAENVRQRSDARESANALAGTGVGRRTMEAAVGRKRLVSLRYIQLGKVRAAARVGCPF